MWALISGLNTVQSAYNDCKCRQISHWLPRHFNHTTFRVHAAMLALKLLGHASALKAPVSDRFRVWHLVLPYMLYVELSLLSMTSNGRQTSSWLISHISSTTCITLQCFAQEDWICVRGQMPGSCSHSRSICSHGIGWGMTEDAGQMLLRGTSQGR